MYVEIERLVTANSESTCLRIFPLLCLDVGSYDVMITILNFSFHCGIDLNLGSFSIAVMIA